MMRQWLRDNWGHVLGISLLATAALTLVHIFFLPALAADEIAFFIWSDHRVMPQPVEEQGPWGFLFRLNEAGYGSSYWTFYLNLILVFGDQAFWLLRALSCGVFVAIPIAVSVVGNRVSKNMGYVLAALWLTMPIAWWCGKTTGPETFALGLGVLGVLLIYVETHLAGDFSPRTMRIVRILGWVSIGGAVSLKLTMVPMAIFALLIRWLFPSEGEASDLRSRLLRSCQAGAWMALSFLVFCPIVVTNPPAFLRRLATLPSGTPWSWVAAQSALSCNTWGWDGVFSGGLLQWSMCPLALAVASLLVLIKSPKVFSATFTAFLACWVMIASKGAVLGWYWFAVVPLLVLAPLWLIKPEGNNYMMKGALGLAIVINAVYQFPEIYARYEMKTQQAVALTRLPEVQAEVAKCTNRMSYDVIVDYWEVSHVGGLKLPESSESKILQMSPTQFASPLEIHEVPGHPGELHRMQIVFSKAFIEILRLGNEGTAGESVLVVLSKRLSSKQGFADFEGYLTNQVLPKSPAGTEFQLLSDLPETAIYEIRTEPVVAEAATDETATK